MTPNPLLLPDLPGDYVLSLVVFDGVSYSLPDTIRITVNEGMERVESLLLNATAVGGIVAWGGNNYGQCDVPEPPENMYYTAISARGWYSLALRSDGIIMGTGQNWYGMFDFPPSPENTAYIAIASGMSHNLALLSDGTVIGRGANWNGQIEVPPLPENMTYTAIAAGFDHSVALRSDGWIIGWGFNYWGEGSDIPPSYLPYSAIAAGKHHNLALLTDGTVIAWGQNDFGQCNVPAVLSDVVAIAAGGWHSLTLRADGTVVAWGMLDTPPWLPNNIVGIAGGSGHSLILLSDGTVAAWGANGMGQCDVPADLAGVIAIAAGESHSLALLPISPLDMLENLGDFIQACVTTGRIAVEMEESLCAKIDAAIAALLRGDPPGAKVAMNDLKALVNQVEAQIDKKIEPATAAEIIACANAIIIALGG